MNKKVFINRTLNLKKIKYIGFDLDHTLVRYNSHNFEKLAYEVTKEKLIKNRAYPESIRSLPFDYDLTIRGLVIDKKQGNLLKLNRFSAIRLSYHGMQKIEFPVQQKLYKSTYIDLGDPSYSAVDTSFSISLATLIAQLVDLKARAGAPLPSFPEIASDVADCLDEAHQDGSLKQEVRRNLDHFLIKSQDVVRGLERFVKHGKKLFVLTNSDFEYTKLLLDYAISPFLKEHKSWMNLFEMIITKAEKPRFFWDKVRFMKVDPISGTMTNFEEPLEPGIYQGGDATRFTDGLNLTGEDILYIGDHIYGDILRLKKDCNWRTALVIEELTDEIENSKKSLKLVEQIQKLMDEKAPFEEKALEMQTRHIDSNATLNQAELEKIQEHISKIDKKISDLIVEHQNYFNHYWGEIMRVGNEESYFASQVERFACIYMSELKDLLECSPRTYFRARRRTMAHEEI